MAESNKSPGFLRFVYAHLWKPLFALASVAVGLLAVGLVRLLWDDPVVYAYAVAVLVAVPVAYVAIEAFGRSIGADDGPIFPWHERRTKILAAGYGLALALAAALMVREINDRDRARLAAEESAREQERHRAMMNDPNVRRGMQALEERRRAREGDGSDE